jgi:hypothetical protein
MVPLHTIENHCIESGSCANISSFCGWQAGEDNSLSAAVHRRLIERDSGFDK